MPFTSIDEINNNPIYNPPASWVTDPLPYLDELLVRSNLEDNGCMWKGLHRVRTRLNAWAHYGVEKRMFILPKYKLFVYENLPISKSHKGSVGYHLQDRIGTGRYQNTDMYTDRRSLKKAELYEWAKMDNLPVKKSTKLSDLVLLLRNM